MAPLKKSNYAWKGRPTTQMRPPGITRAHQISMENIVYCLCMYSEVTFMLPQLGCFSASLCTVKLSACPSFFSQLLNMHLIFAVNLISAWHNILSNQLTYWKSNYFYSDYLQLMQQAYSSPKTTNMYSVIKKIWYINISDISYKDLCHHVVMVRCLISSSYYLYVMPLKPELVWKGCRSVFIYQQSSSYMMILQNRMWPKSPNMGM